MPKYNRESHLLKTYGITTRQWNKLYKLQNGICPICKRKIYKAGNKEGKKAAATDHDHTTGRVRGLLCFTCNKYKVAKNNLESALEVVAYLRTLVDGRNL